VVTTDGKNVYPVFRWEGDDLILDNSKTFLNEAGTRIRPEVLFGTKLVEAMKWIRREDPNTGFFIMTGNLNTEADSVPTDVNRDWAYINRERTYAEYWSYSPEGLQLSSYFNWRFTYLDEDYRNAFGGSGTTPTPHRSPMYVYSNVGQSMVTGNQVTDLLREIPHTPHTYHLEPVHPLYLAVRTDVLEIVETEVAEHDGTLVNFAGGGVTVVTLHFTYD